MRKMPARRPNKGGGQVTRVVDFGFGQVHVRRNGARRWGSTESVEIANDEYVLNQSWAVRFPVSAIPDLMSQLGLLLLEQPAMGDLVERP
jgi:hypothetical protein